MALPSGSIIHRNYLCFIWHPALEELRRYIREHHTHPDDQTVSAIISQLSGKVSSMLPSLLRELACATVPSCQCCTIVMNEE